MQYNWAVKRYDQSVTCLADDPRNLETRSSTLRTPAYSIANKQAYNKQSSKGTGKTQIRDLTRKFNLRTPVCKKRIKSNKTTKLKRRKKQASFTNLD